MQTLQLASEQFFEGLRALNVGDLQKAEACLLKALELAPDRPSALVNLSVVYAKQNRLTEALASAERALGTNSEPIYWLQKGAVLLKLERFEDALKSFEEALSGEPNMPEAHNNKGSALRGLRRFDEALASYDKAIDLKADYPEALNNRGATLRDLQRIEEALESYDRAISLKPNFAEVHCNRGIALKERSRLEEALVSYDTAISLNPDYAEAYLNRGKALSELNRHDEALESYDRAISLKPDFAEAYSNRGNVLSNLNRLVEGLASYDEAIRLKPEDSTAKFGKSFIQLQKGLFREGFELQLPRWSTPEFKHKVPKTTVPAWDGLMTTGVVLLWAEQGIGDEVFYASMLSLLDTDKQRITLSADSRLHSIFARSFPKIRLVDRKLTKAAIPNEFGAQAPIGNLGHLLMVDENRIGQRKHPYLMADHHLKSKLRRSHFPSKQTRVCGIAWRSGNKKLGSARTIELVDFSPLWSCSDIDFVNLQYGDVGSEIASVKQRFGREILTIPGIDLFSDIDGLLAIIAMCDVVLTIDNVTAHLAGAIGQKGVVLIPSGKGRYWYWGGEARSRWYPNLNLVYQKQVGDWSSVIQEGLKLVRQIANPEENRVSRCSVPAFDGLDQS